MNCLKILCCSEKQKPPQRKMTIKKVIFKDQSLQQSITTPNSQPFNLADKYKGQQLNGQPNGNGQMMYKNGDYYRGQWVNGQKQGRGLQIYNQQGYRYQGQWKANFPNGHGKIVYDDGSSYVGEFRDNLKHGKGEFYDVQNVKVFQQLYDYGMMKKQCIKSGQPSREDQFPTLVLDKERFNTQDLQIFQKENPQIKQLQVTFLAKYYSMCKVVKLNFIRKNLKQWGFKQIHDFLVAIDLIRCKDIFYKNKIKGAHLFTITQKQMKEDLNLKLGDRKRLLYYCKFLSEIHYEQKKKKQNKKGQGSKKNISERQRRFSQKAISSERFYDKFITAFIDQQNIIEQQNQCASEQQSFQNSQKSSDNYKDAAQRQFHQVYANEIAQPNYFTQEWNENYNSQEFNKASKGQNRKKTNSQDQQQHYLSDQSHSWGSNKSVVPSKKDQSFRKISGESPQDMLANNLITIIPKNIIKKSRALSIKMPFDGEQSRSKSFKNIQQKQKSSTSSSQSSVSQYDGAAPQLIKKKTVIKPKQGMQIRQLYQFLRERGNLQFIIKQREIQLLNLIGEGGYGKVYQGKYMGTPVAVKDYIKTGRHQIQEDFLKELEILSDLKHPNIVLYMGICITADKYQLVTEYLQNGSLFDQIHRKKKIFTRAQVLQIIDDIVKGMVYLHNMKNILHRDLKSSNVLLDQDWKVKLCDFGLSGHKKKSSKKKKGRIGTYQWMAPQVMKKQDMDFFSDVYSFGVIIWELLTNKIPYEGYTENQIIGEVGYDEDYKLKIIQTEAQWQQDDFIVQLMNECVKRVPAQRPTFIQIQSKLNEYFQNVARQQQRALQQFKN